MPLHIKDKAANDAVRRLAHVRSLTLTEAVRVACEEALARDDRALTVVDRLKDIHRQVRTFARTGQKADKAFFDGEWGE
ncbi:antitoxin VapB [Roseiarcus fermentans]|uniref:Antitoxin VapB n=1 Tax=Roseiarcus fermentans TaxID=1473586 RepID=A0A366FQN7_9HYPH|nr:type II toxin-antitoxin system VapB family antitoxin [Roseiarcus fermentans]RBP16861.1 antitoxin VapB [Roseiarcus fermentans]